MKSSIVVFVLAFAAMGLLLGFAASLSPSMNAGMLRPPPQQQQQQPPSLSASNNSNTVTPMNGTSIGIGEQVTAQVNRAQ
ncbi:MAG: hypothetical protein C4292_00155 [Nitrososphaera sp.]